MKEFLKYYFRTNTPGWVVNYIWTFGSVLLAFLFIHTGSYRNDDVALYMLSTVPMLMLVYNIVSELNIFKKLQIDSHLLAMVFYGSCLTIILSVFGLLCL